MSTRNCFIVLLILLTILSCTEKEIIRELASTDTFNPFTVPEVVTSTVSSVTASTATSGGIIASDGRAPVTSRGVCWSTDPEPTIALNTKTIDGTGEGSFVSSLTGLSANTRYYIRAYATNSAGTAYGSQAEFTTLPTSSILFSADMSVITGWAHFYSGSATPGMWNQIQSNEAGGVSPELTCISASSPGSSGTSRLRTPPINTTGYTSLKLTFKHIFFDYGPGLTLKVQTSSDGQLFHDTSWSIVSQSYRTIGPATVTITLNQDLNVPTTYIGFYLIGDLYQFMYWSIDDVVVSKN